MDLAKHSAARLGDRRSIAFPTATFRGTLLSLIVGAIFLFFFTFLLYRTSDPTRFFHPMAITATMLLSFCGGFRAGRLHRKSGPLCGLTVGASLSFLFLLVALVIMQGKLPLAAIPLYLGILTLSTLGGSLATRKKRRRAHKR